MLINYDIKMITTIFSKLKVTEFYCMVNDFLQNNVLSFKLKSYQAINDKTKIRIYVYSWKCV